jgi:hypothetical protein
VFGQCLFESRFYFIAAFHTDTIIDGLLAAFRIAPFDAGAMSFLHLAQKKSKVAKSSSAISGNVIILSVFP